MRSTAYAVACCGLLCLFAGSALAQQQDQQGNDLRPLLDRIDRLERDMNLLQRQVYRGTGPAGAPAAPPAEGQAALTYEVRMSQIEDQLRDLTGQIQQISHDLDQLKQRVETLSNDVDQRLAVLEHGGAAPPPGIGGPRPLAGGPPPGAPPPGAPGLSPPPHVLGQLPVGAGQTAAAGAAVGAGTASPPAPASPPPATPQQQYDAAFKLLREANYPAAETALRAFIQRYPKDPLAGNAQYWLGETYFVRKDYANAAAVFADGYQKYPKGGKAADNLLKLGMALAQLGQKADACHAFARLEHDFPTAPATVKDRAGEEKKRLGCS